MIECEAVLFDLDGVLVDSAACIERTWATWATLQGLDVAAVVLAAHGRRAVETVRRVAPRLNAVEEAARLAELEAITSVGVRSVPGADALLDALSANRWAIVTSAVRAVAEHRLRLTRLPVPRIMICAEDVEKGKPDAEGYLAAAKRLGFEAAQCVVVEDAPAGLTAAQSAGMRAIALSTTHSAEELNTAILIAPSLDSIEVDVKNPSQVPGLRIRIRRGE
jgi:sugar-phosphatase